MPFKIRLLKFFFVIFGIVLLPLMIVARLLGGASGQTEHLDDTLRLYHRTEEGLKFAWFYEIDGRLYIDRGTVGEMAHRRNMPLEDWPAVDAEIEAARSIGFAEASNGDWEVLQIIYKVEGDGFATTDELTKRNELLNELDEFFALTGQGHWIDASSGGGTMELAFEVIDSAIAKESTQARLAGTKFADYLIMRDRFEHSSFEEVMEEAKGHLPAH